MKTMRPGTAGRPAAACSAIALAGALSIVPLLGWVEARRGDAGPAPDLLYFSAPGAVRKMALGYERLLADVYWLRTVQYFGQRDAADRRTVRYGNLAALLDITTTLDPGMIDTYRAGSIFLGESEPIGAGEPAKAVALLDKGIRANPDVWQLRYDKGFVLYLYLQDFRAAGEVWLEAGQRPGAPQWMAGLAAQAFSRGGSMDLARALWRQQYEESTRDDIRENAKNRLLSLQVAEDLWTLERHLAAYRHRNGAWPRRLGDLPARRSGLLPAADPLGTPYAYDPATGAVGLGPQSKVVYLEIPESYREEFLRTTAAGAD